MWGGEKPKHANHGNLSYPARVAAEWKTAESPGGWCQALVRVTHSPAEGSFPACGTASPWRLPPPVPPAPHAHPVRCPVAISTLFP